MSDEVAQLETQSTSLAGAAGSMTIESSQDYSRAGEFLRSITEYIARVGVIMDPIVEAAHRAHKVAVQRRDALLRPAQDAKRTLGMRMAGWESQRREAEVAAQREAHRLAQLARERAEAEERRLAEEAESRQLAEAARLEAEGRIDEAVKLVEQPVAAPIVVPAAVVMQAPTPAAPALDGVSYRDRWDFEIVDVAAVPREFMMIDEKKIRGVVRAMKDATRIPGVRVFAERSAVVRQG